LLDSAAWWFTDCLTVILPESTFGPLLEYMDGIHDFRKFAGKFLHDVGTGIKDLKVEENKLPADQIPPPLLAHLQNSKENDEYEFLLNASSIRYQLDPENPAQVIRRNLTSRHITNEVDFRLPFHEESDGTKRCLELLPALYNLERKCQVFVIDEMDRSLHPMLSHAILKFFVESCPGACRQMIFTTHTTHLLDLDILRRDEIWFAEKGPNHETHIYSLSDLKVRNDVQIEKGYLQGRFGSIPFIKDQKNLMDLLPCPVGDEA